MQLTISHGGLGRPLRLPADFLLIHSDAGTLLAVVHQWGPAGWTMTRVGDPDFASVVTRLGADRVTFVDDSVPVPRVAMLDHPR